MQTVREILDRLPDDCTLEDVLYRLYVVNAVETGRREIENGKAVPHEEAEMELRRRWIPRRAE